MIFRVIGSVPGRERTFSGSSAHHPIRQFHALLTREHVPDLRPRMLMLQRQRIDLRTQIRLGDNHFVAGCRGNRHRSYLRHELTALRSPPSLQRSGTQTFPTASTTMLVGVATGSAASLVGKLSTRNTTASGGSEENCLRARMAQSQFTGRLPGIGESPHGTALCSCFHSSGIVCFWLVCPSAADIIRRNPIYAGRMRRVMLAPCQIFRALAGC